MLKRHSYQGKLNGVNGVWCDQCPEGLEVKETITFYTPDDGKMFVKDGKLFDSVVIKDDVKIEDYIEIEIPKEEEPTTEGDKNGD